MTLFNDFRDDIPALRKPRVVKAKPVTTSKYDLKKLYYDARRVMFQRQYPEAWAVGGYYDNTYPDINKTNGTMNYIQDVLNNLGHACERINTMGIPGKDGQWRRSGSTKGSADISAIIKIPSQAFPVPWKIEVKRGSDKLNHAQEKYQANMNKVGALHSVVQVGNLDFFWDEYNRILKL